VSSRQTAKQHGGARFQCRDLDAADLRTVVASSGKFEPEPTFEGPIREQCSRIGLSQHEN